MAGLVGMNDLRLMAFSLSAKGGGGLTSLVLPVVVVVVIMQVVVFPPLYIELLVAHNIKLSLE